MGDHGGPLSAGLGDPGDGLKSGEVRNDDFFAFRSGGGWLSVAVEFEADLSGDLDLGTRWDWACF